MCHLGNSQGEGSKRSRQVRIRHLHLHLQRQTWVCSQQLPKDLFPDPTSTNLPTGEQDAPCPAPCPRSGG